MQKIIFGLLLFLFPYSAYSATVKGKVTDKNTGEELIGAYVSVKENTKYVSVTGLDGSYSLQAGNADPYTLVCSYMGYKTAEVKVGQEDATVNLQLEPAAEMLAEVEVIGSHHGRTEAAARDIEKRSANVVNVMSARAIELSPDQTVANVIQRMSGVTIERNTMGEGQYAILRGMDKRYNYTLVNGVKIPSPDNKNRFVPLDIFPSEMLDRLEVHKSLTADLEGDGIGGAVNIVMKDAPTERQFTFNVQTGYNTMFFDHDFTSFAHSGINRKSPNEIHGENYAVSMEDFTLSNLRTENKTALPDISAGVSYGDRFFDNKLGLMVVGSFQNNYYGKRSQLHYQPGSNYTGVTERFYSEQQMRIGAHTKLDYYPNRDNKLMLYAGYMDMRAAQARDAVNPQWERMRLRWNRQYIFNSTLKGEHGFLSDNALKLKWTASASKAYNQTPDNAEIELTTASNGLQTAARSGTTRRWEHNDDRDFSGYADLSYRLDLGGADRGIDFMAGGMYRDKKRTSLYHEYFFGVPDDNRSQVRGRDWNTFDEIEWDVNRFGNLTDPLNYNAYERIAAGYASAKYTGGIAELTAGIRLEHTNQGYDLLHATEGARNHGGQNYLDALPSAHLKIEVHDNAKVHASYYRAINRPSFFEIVPYNIINEDYKERGNPDLKHTVADNIDLRYEFFPGSSEQIMAGVFYKRIKDPIEYGFDTSGQDTYFTPDNYGTANNFGLEVDVMKYFNWFGIKANYTYTHSNITTTKTEIIDNPDNPGTTITHDREQRRPLAGQAAHVANVSLLFKAAKQQFEGQISGSYTGKRLSEVSKYYEDDIWENGNFQLDLSVEKTFKKGISLFAKATNLLDGKIVRYIPSNSRNANFSEEMQRYNGGILERKEWRGRTILIGFRYKL